MTTPDGTSKPAAAAPTFRDAVIVWLRVAALSFGGPAGQIAVMHRILVDEKRWIGESRFLHALNYCTLLPGPEAQQLATYLGWLFHGTAGGLVAGGLFVLPGFLSLLGLSALYVLGQQSLLVTGLFLGLKPAVLAIVVEALIRIGRRVLKNRLMALISATAFLAIFLFRVPFPAIVLAAAGFGMFASRWWPDEFPAFNSADDPNLEPDSVPDRTRANAPPSLVRSLGTALVWLSIWAAPLVLIADRLGREHILFSIGLFLSKLAVVTFGGAYAVLAWLSQEAVNQRGWLTPGEMLDGLGLGETTPGPLIQVVQFVAFLAAYRNPEPWSPMTAGILGSIVATWVTFAPSFLWIFLGAPYVERLRGQRMLAGALKCITAAVVGVILNLAVWFSLQTLFHRVNDIRLGWLQLSLPEWSTWNGTMLFLTALAFVLLFALQRGMIWTLAVSAAVGALITAFRGL